MLEEEAWRQILSSLVVCFFARGIYSLEAVVKAFRALGEEVAEDSLRAKGKEILKAKYSFKVREGFSLTNLRIPERVLQTPSPLGRISKRFVEEALNLAERKLSSL